MQNFEDMLINMPVIASPPAELVNLVNELFDVGEPRMANDQGVQPLVLQTALLEEQARQAQVEEDAALADLLQDEFIDEDTAEEEEEKEEVQVENELMDGVEEQVIDSDAETVDNNPPEPMEDSDNVVDDDSDLDMSEVTLRRMMRVRDRFFRGVQHLLRLQRGEDMRCMRRRLRHIQRRIRRREDRPHDVPRRYRCLFCGFWLCPDCNVDPVHCQNERQCLP